ncbi:MAG: hypothetical protein R3F01_12065 [Lysobacteraceae bacterium]
MPPMPISGSLSVYEQWAVWASLGLSELLALFVIRQAWRSHRHLAEKCMLTAMAIVPVVGLFFAWWLQNDPGPAAPAFRDHRTYEMNVLNRWLHVFQERNKKAQARKYEELVRTYKDDI